MKLYTKLITPLLLELGKQRQVELKDNQGYIERPCLKTIQNNHKRGKPFVILNNLSGASLTWSLVKNRVPSSLYQRTDWAMVRVCQPST